MAFDDTATVSGSVVSIENGADEVGAKSCVVTVRPTLSGVSEVTETQTGRNLFDISTATNGQINGTNGAYYANANWQASDFFPVHGADLTLSWDTDSSNYYQVNLAFYDSEKHYVDGLNNTFANIYSKTFTIPNGAVYCRASWSISVGGSPAPRNNIRINLGSTDGGYEPYTAPTQYTASLGRTIHGGQVDIVNGEGTENCKKITLGDFTWIKSGTEGNFYCSQVTDIWYPSEGGISRYGIGVSDEFQFVQGTPADGQINAYFNTAYSGYRIFIKKADYADRTSAEFKEYLQSINAHLVYKVNDASTTDFTFEPVKINTRLGYNAFWSEHGNTELTYYKSGYGFTSVTVHKETPEGEPVVQTVKFHRIVYGGQADVVRGTCKNYYSDSVTFDGSNDEVWQKHGTIASWFYIDHYLTGAYANNNENDFIMSSWGNQRKYLNVVDIANGEYAYGVNERFVIKNTSFTEVADFKAWLAQNPVTIVYKLATPSTFSFPPISISTDDGENNLFANEGDSAITYRKAVE